jgi:hypothetical protein
MSLLPGDGKLFRQISTPSGVALWIGLGLLGSLLLPNQFSYVRLRWGVALIFLSFAWAHLSLARQSVVSYTGFRSKSTWWFSKLLSGLLFLACAVVILLWPIWPTPYKQFFLSLAG